MTSSRIPNNKQENDFIINETMHHLNEMTNKMAG